MPGQNMVGQDAMNCCLGAWVELANRETEIDLTDLASSVVHQFVCLLACSGHFLLIRIFFILSFALSFFVWSAV
jgi:hypothetical protein